MLLSSRRSRARLDDLGCRGLLQARLAGISGAIRRLWLDGQPGRPGLVWDELGELRFASSITDGPSVLVTLSRRRPATSSTAARYAEIVEDLAATKDHRVVERPHRSLYRRTEWHEHLSRVLDLPGTGTGRSLALDDRSPTSCDPRRDRRYPGRPLAHEGPTGRTPSPAGSTACAAPSVAGKTCECHRFSIRQTTRKWEGTSSSITETRHGTSSNGSGRVGADLEAVGDPGGSGA